MIIFFLHQIIDTSLFSLNMWLYSFILKLLPCGVLTILTACLIQALYKVRNITLNMRLYNILFQVEENSQKLRKGATSKLAKVRTESTDKTTKLLSTILILFLVAEFPQVFITNCLSTSDYHFLSREYWACCQPSWVSSSSLSVITRWGR